MRSRTESRTIVLDAGTVRAFDDAVANLDIDVEAFTVAHLFIETSARAGDATLDVALTQGATVAAAYRSTAYTPPDGAIAQFVTNTTIDRRVLLKSQRLRVALTMGGTAGSFTTRIWITLKPGNAL